MYVFSWISSITLNPFLTLEGTTAWAGAAIDDKGFRGGDGQIFVEELQLSKEWFYIAVPF